MFPAIMAIISMAKQKAAAENQDLQNLQQQQQINTSNIDIPTINSVFGR
jgi:enolase